MKYLIKFYTILILTFFFSLNSHAADKIKIGLVIPLTGENKELGESVLKSVRLAINDINDDKIIIIPKDNQNNPDRTLEVSKELYDEGIKIIIGPIFKKNTYRLSELNNDLTFLSFTNKIDDSKKNIISAGVNAISQFNAVKKFQTLNEIERSYLFAPDTDILQEIKIGVKKSKVKLKDKFYYDPDPTLITKQIEDVTRYRVRKQNLADELIRVENSSDVNKEKKISKLKKLDTIGGELVMPRRTMHILRIIALPAIFAFFSLVTLFFPQMTQVSYSFVTIASVVCLYSFTAYLHITSGYHLGLAVNKKGNG